MDLVTALLAIMILKPMRLAFLAKSKKEMVSNVGIAAAYK
jgi:hypothetical protein